MAEYKIILNLHRTTLQVTANKYVESFDIVHMTKPEISDRVKWACITGGIKLADETILDLLRANKVIP